MTGAALQRLTRRKASRTDAQSHSTLHRRSKPYRLRLCQQPRLPTAYWCALSSSPETPPYRLPDLALALRVRHTAQFCTLATLARPHSHSHSHHHPPPRPRPGPHPRRRPRPLLSLSLTTHRSPSTSPSSSPIAESGSAQHSAAAHRFPGRGQVCPSEGLACVDGGRPAAAARCFVMGIRLPWCPCRGMPEGPAAQAVGYGRRRVGGPGSSKSDPGSLRAVCARPLASLEDVRTPPPRIRLPWCPCLSAYAFHGVPA